MDLRSMDLFWLGHLASFALKVALVVNKVSDACTRAKGHYSYGAELMELAMDRVRKDVELCDQLLQSCG